MAIASNCGIFGLSHLGDYCGSKFAVIGMKRRVFADRYDISIFEGYMECVEDEIFRSKCSGVNTTSNDQFDRRFSTLFDDHFSRYHWSIERWFEQTCERNRHVNKSSLFSPFVYQCNF